MLMVRNPVVLWAASNQVSKWKQESWTIWGWGFAALAEAEGTDMGQDGAVISILPVFCRVTLVTSSAQEHLSLEILA